MSIITSIQQYLLDISDRKPLTNEQEDVLFQQLDQVRRGELPQEMGAHIVHQLIEGSLHMVVHIATCYYTAKQAASGGRSGLSLDDLIQVGNVALVECVQYSATHEQTNPDFSAYVSSYIRYALIDARRRSLPLSVSKKDWREAAEQGIAHHLCTALSLDAVPQGAEGNGHPLSDRIAAPTEVPVPLSIYEKKRERVAQLLATLTDQEQHIICLRYGLNEDDQRVHNYQEIADQVGCVPTTCRNLEHQILHALRDGTPLRHSPDYYSASEAIAALGISPTGFRQRVTKGTIQRYFPSGCDHMGVYRKTEIDALAQEYRELTQKYYTVEQVEARLSVTDSAINKWTREGKLTRYQVPGRNNYGGLFLKEEIDQLIRQQEEAATLYYTASEAAVLLGISTGSIHRWVREGSLTRYRYRGLSQRGYLKEEVNRIVIEQETLRRDYYTVGQAAALVGLSEGGFTSWAKRLGVTASRRTLDRVNDLYSKTEIDALVQEEQQFLQDTYSLKETSMMMGVGVVAIHKWVKAGKITRLQRPGCENYGGRYLKTEVDTIARFLKKQTPVTNITPLYEEVYAYAQ